MEGYVYEEREIAAAIEDIGRMLVLGLGTSGPGGQLVLRRRK